MNKLRVFSCLIIISFFGSFLMSNTLFSPNSVDNGENLNSNNPQIDVPRKSAGELWDYFPEDIPFIWEDLESKEWQSNVRNITDWFSNKDDGYYSARLPGNFRLYDYYNSYIYISTNGYISLEDSTPDLNGNMDFPQSGIDYGHMIAAFWDDLDLYKGGAVYIANLTGTKDRWVVEYKDVYHFNGNFLGSFEIVLYEDFSIQFNFEEILYIADGYTTGINRGDGIMMTQTNLFPEATSPVSILYKDEDQILYEDFEGTLDPRWSGIGSTKFWHVTDTDSYNGDQSLWCANSTSGDYNKKSGGSNIRAVETVIIKDLDLREYYNATMKFYYKKETENSNIYDVLNISAKINTNHLYLSPKYTNVKFNLTELYWNISSWIPFELDLSFFCGYEHLDLIFTFDTKDNVENSYPGFKMDDLSIIGHKKFRMWSQDLCIEEGDEFVYRMDMMDSSAYSQYLHDSPIGFPEDEIRIKIYKITEYDTYWDIEARFWEFTDDNEVDGQSETIHYKIYKFSINLKAGSDFFLPCTDVHQYLLDADNVEKDWYRYQYNIHQWSDFEYDCYCITIQYDNYKVDRIYNGDGLLKELKVYKNRWEDDWEHIYQFFFQSEDDEYYDENGSEEDIGPEDVYVNIPGYDLLVVLASVFIASCIPVYKLFAKRKD